MWRVFLWLWSSFACSPPSLAATEPTLSLRDPVVVGGLAVYLVLDPQAPSRPAGEVKLLSAALADGSLTVSEVDAGGSVPDLLAHNKGSVPILGVAGDVVKGGKQDRVLTQDVIIPPSASPQSIAVNCVERSRWSAESGAMTFGYAGRSEVDLTKTLQVDKDQQATWAKVATLNAGRDADPSTGTYRASLAHQEASGAVASAMSTFAALDDPHAVGLVVAIDGALSTAEVYHHPSLFKAAREALLRSVVLDAEARSVLERKAAAPSAAAATAWLKAAFDSAPVATTAQPASAYREAETAGTKSFELDDASGETVKRTVYTK